ncbi:MAG: FAD-dependent oxidoreductase [Cyclobacteriaceae bacterium]
METSSDIRQHQILILGGGTAGITAAAQLLRKNKNLDIAILEPSEKHYYQPAWTLVGAGAYDMADTIRDEKDYIPKNTTWIKEYAEQVDADNNIVITRGGQKIKYKYLIVAVGIQLDWDGIPGLKEGIGKNGICSNYSQEYAEYTYECIQNFKGGNALFTQPATPVKCGGAPQKIMYLAEDYFRKHGMREQTNVIFATPGSVIFGVKEFAKTLNNIVHDRDIYLKLFHKLVEIRPDTKEAVYELSGAETGCVTIDDVEKKLRMKVEGETRVVIPFEMLHTAPPQSAPDFIKKSSLAVEDNPLGWVDVDKYTLQHKKYPNVFALGDVANLPTAKTGAAVRKQAPVVVKNLLTVMEHASINGNKQYNGYSSCPLVTSYGKMVLAEFDYDNNPAPSFPIDTTKERYSMWLFKKHFLPWMYWNAMLKGIA